MTGGAPAQPTIKVWDAFVRIAHWSLVVSVLGAWLTQDSGAVHEWLGYAALAIVLARLSWGWFGTPHARFGQFVRSPADTLRYSRQVLARTEPRHVGHNPLGAYMIVALVVMVVLVSATGWLYTTDAYWGVEWVEALHEALSNALILLVALHLGGVAFSSWRHRENLVAAMIHGRKRAPAQDDVA
jgi:cytochrome b